MWSRRLYTLLPLTEITPNKRKCRWTKIIQNDFGLIKWIVDRYTLLTYPDFNE